MKAPTRFSHHVCPIKQRVTSSEIIELVNEIVKAHNDVTFPEAQALFYAIIAGMRRESYTTKYYIGYMDMKTLKGLADSYKKTHSTRTHRKQT